MAIVSIMKVYQQTQGKIMKSISEITLYELMAEDISVWLCKNRKFGFDLEIDGETWEPIVKEEKIHPCAAESFASFCRRYLDCYERAIKDEAA